MSMLTGVRMQESRIIVTVDSGISDTISKSTEKDSDAQR